MHEDLESIANLRLGQAIELASREYSQEMSAALANLAKRGMTESGLAIQTRINLGQKCGQKVCRATYDIWLDLILQRNHGRLTEADEGFINSKIKQVTDAQARNIRQ